MQQHLLDLSIRPIAKLFLTLHGMGVCNDLYMVVARSETKKASLKLGRQDHSTEDDRGLIAQFSQQTLVDLIEKEGTKTGSDEGWSRLSRSSFAAQMFRALYVCIYIYM